MSPATSFGDSFSHLWSAPANLVGTSGGSNRKGFECGVDLGRLLKTSPKRLLRSFNADSEDGVTVGYFVMTPPR
jgi:hypothetical protein